MSGERMRRLSPGAWQWLERLAAPGAHIAFLGERGSFYFCIADRAERPIMPKTVDAFVTARLLTRNRGVPFPDYLITDLARDAVREMVRARCEAGGHRAGEGQRCECGHFATTSLF